MLEDIGVSRRLRRILPPDRIALWLPLDDGLISGPEDHLRDPRKLLSPEILSNVTGVLGFKGMIDRCRGNLADSPLIMNLTASTVRHRHTRKLLIGSVEEAIRANADAVACHVNVTSPYQDEQMRLLGELAETAGRYGVPVVAMAYPRTCLPDGSDDNYSDLRRENEEAFAELVRHCVRLSVELGASAVKTIYTGSVPSFRTVVESAMGVPVLIAGEHKLDFDEAIRKGQDAVKAGAAGVAFGRQIFQREEPVQFVRKLRSALDDERYAQTLRTPPL